MSYPNNDLKHIHVSDMITLTPESEATLMRYHSQAKSGAGNKELNKLILEVAEKCLKANGIKEFDYREHSLRKAIYTVTGKTVTLLGTHSPDNYISDPLITFVDSDGQVKADGKRNFVLLEGKEKLNDPGDSGEPFYEISRPLRAIEPVVGNHYLIFYNIEDDTVIEFAQAAFLRGEMVFETSDDHIGIENAEILREVSVDYNGLVNDEEVFGFVTVVNS